GVSTTHSSNLTSVNSTDYQILGASQFCTNENYSIQNLPSGVSVTWSVTGSGTIVSTSVSSNVLTVTRLSDGNVTVNATVNICGSPLAYQKSVRVGGEPIVVTANQIGCDEIELSVSGAASSASFHWSSANNTALFNGISTTLTSTGPVTALVTKDEIIVNTTNTCSQSSFGQVTYNPYAREISGLYPEYISCGDHLSLSVNTTPFDTYYRWYVN